MTNYLTQEEKIDYIFKELKSQKKTRFFKIFFRIFIFLGIIIFYFYILPNLDKEKIMWTISDYVIDISKPMVEELVKETATSNLDMDSLIKELKK